MSLSLKKKKKESSSVVCLSSPPLTFAAAAAALGQSEREETRVARPCAVPQWQTTWPDSRAGQRKMSLAVQAVLAFLSGLRLFLCLLPLCHSYSFFSVFSPFLASGMEETLTKKRALHCAVCRVHVPLFAITSITF